MCFRPNRLDSVVSSLRQTAKDILYVLLIIVSYIYIYKCVYVCVSIFYVCVVGIEPSVGMLHGKKSKIKTKMLKANRRFILL